MRWTKHSVKINTNMTKHFESWKIRLFRVHALFSLLMSWMGQSQRKQSHIGNRIITTCPRSSEFSQLILIIGTLAATLTTNTSNRDSDRPDLPQEARWKKLNPDVANVFCPHSLISAISYKMGFGRDVTTTQVTQTCQTAVMKRLHKPRMMNTDPTTWFVHSSA